MLAGILFAGSEAHATTAISSRGTWRCPGPTAPCVLIPPLYSHVTYAVIASEGLFDSADGGTTTLRNV
jgi:hypothetical protein